MLFAILFVAAVPPSPAAAQGEPLPDFMVASLAVPNDVVHKEGTRLWFYATITNGGGAAGTALVQFLADGAPIAEPWWREPPLQPFNVTLAAGESVTLESPMWRIPVGEHVISVEIDFGDNLTESDETNNAASATVSAYRMDLPNYVLQHVNVTLTPYGHKALYSVTSFGINDGREANAYSHNTTFNGRGYGQTWGPGKGPQDMISTRSGGTLGPGTWQITVTLDNLEEVVEASETDNALSQTVTVPEPTPTDLVIREIEIDAPVMEHGCRFRVRALVENAGPGAVGYTHARVLMNGEEWQNVVVPALEPGESAWTTWSPHMTALGDHRTLTLAVDSTYAAIDTDRSNNNMTVPFEVAPADLSVEIVNVETQTGVGAQNRVVTVEVCNAGAGFIWHADVRLWISHRNPPPFGSSGYDQNQQASSLSAGECEALMFHHGYTLRLGDIAYTAQASGWDYDPDATNNEHTWSEPLTTDVPL